MKKLFILSLLGLSLITLQASADTIWVDIKDYNYTPLHLYVPVGTTVTWTNYDVAQHTVTEDNGLFDSGLLSTNSTFSYTFNTVGNYNYHCTPHPMMTAMVHVRTTATMSFALNLTPVGTITIPPGGGSYSYTAYGTNQTTASMTTTYWTKVYYPNNTFLQTFLKGVTVPAGGTRGTTLSQSIPGSAPAGLYHFFGYVGTNPDSAIAWDSFTFTKSGVAIGETGWETTILSDWSDIPAVSQRVETNTVRNDQIKLWNSPEPFNPSTVINYSLPAEGTVELKVYNMSGALVATLANGFTSAGEHQVTFNAGSLPSGLYIYRLSFGGEAFTNKMLLVK